MSWDSYVKNMESEGCVYAAFFDIEGNKWAETKNPCLNVTAAQVQHFVKALRPPNSVDLKTEGARLGDRKFLVVDVTTSSAIMKQLGGTDKIMACVGVFNKGVCIGAASAGEREKASRISVEKYTDYLRSLNY